MGGLVRYAITAQQWRHVREFEAATADPAAAQARVLRRLLNDNVATTFGREHGFATLATPAAYARRVPIRDYEAFRPWMTRVAAWEKNVLTAETPLAFAATSGTTGEPKLVPVTPRSAQVTADLMRLWTRYALRSHPAMLDRKLLTMVAPAVEGFTPSGLPFGAMTGLTYQRLPWLVRRRHALPYAAALIRDHETRYFVTARLALAQAVSCIAMPNPSTLLRLADTVARRGSDLIAAIHDGTLGVEETEPVAHAGMSGHELHAALAAAACADRTRAAALDGIASRHGSLALGVCWPELALIACWLGGSAGIQARHLDAHVPARVARRDLGLVASEGRLTIPVDDDTAAGVLAVHAGFFEFVPEDEIDDQAPRTLLCHELEEGRRYYVIVTGANGLYRYDLNDIVEVHGFHHRTPKLAFVRKGRDMASITGEKLHLNHALHAVRAAERASGIGVWQFGLIPDVDAACYDLLLELARPASNPEALQRFAEAFDDGLASVNVEYASKRASARLRAPRLFVMRAGWSERVCRREYEGSRREAQHKWSAMRAQWDDVSRGDVIQRVEPCAQPEVVS